MIRPEFDAEFLRSILDYDRASGVFTWRRRSDVQSSWNTRYAGKTAGFNWKIDNHQYRSIRIRDWPFLAHVIAYLHVTGDWPLSVIDHADRNGLNNSWSNLRSATAILNAANSKRHRDNKSGFKGVSWCKNRGKWRATIGHNSRQIWLGYHDTPEAAHAAYIKKAYEIHGEFARGS